MADVAGTRSRRDVLRRSAPLVAVAAAVVATVTDPAGWAAAELAIPVALFAVWAWWPALPSTVLAVGVLVSVGAAQLSGGLEPAMFMIAIAVVIVARYERWRWWVALTCLVLVLSPAVVVALQPTGNRIAWGIWVIGFAFSVVVGRGMYRQELLSVELDAARAQLARQALAEERRRIARDVHDLVGHGLAAVLLQVASARHVLRRDVEAADQALATAETVGRGSMRELRTTVTLLRSVGESATPLALPDLAQLDGLIDSTRGEGLIVDYRADGDLAGVPAAVGLALYRIAQEALHNAARHAPRASTAVVVAVTSAAVTLEVDSDGAPTHPPDGAPHYGLVGMRERAATVGGTVEAGPTSRGWRVRARVPVASP